MESGKAATAKKTLRAVVTQSWREPVRKARSPIVIRILRGWIWKLEEQEDWWIRTVVLQSQGSTARRETRLQVGFIPMFLLMQLSSGASSAGTLDSFSRRYPMWFGWITNYRSLTRRSFRGITLMYFTALQACKVWYVIKFFYFCIDETDIFLFTVTFFYDLRVVCCNIVSFFYGPLIHIISTGQI